MTNKSPQISKLEQFTASLILIYTCLIIYILHHYYVELDISILRLFYSGLIFIFLTSIFLFFAIQVSKISELLARILLLLLVLILPSILVGSLHSNQHFGNNLTFSLVYDTIVHDQFFILNLKNFFTDSYIILPLIFLFSVAFLFLMISNILTLTKFMYFKSTKSQLLGLFSSLIIMLLVFQLSPLKLIQNEPLLNFFGLVPLTTDIAGNDSYRLSSDQRDAITRSNYRISGKINKKNIILIMFDSLRADHLPIYGYDRQTTPFLSELQKKGELQKIDYFFSSCSESYCGIASSLTGHPYYKIGNNPFTLFEALKIGGYRNHVLVTGAHRTWAGLKNIYKDLPNDSKIISTQTKLIEYWSDFITEKTSMHDDKAIILGLEKLSNSSTPSFFFIFPMVTHLLGERSSEFDRWLPASDHELMSFWGKHNLASEFKEKYSRKLEKKDLELLKNNYDNGVLEADNLLRQIFDKLDQKGFLKNSIVIITGDHGDALGEHDHVGHTSSLYNEDIKVPLLFWSSEKIDIVNNYFAYQADITPTILDLVKIPIPFSIEGNSLLKDRKTNWTIHQTRKGKSPCAASIVADKKSLFKYISCKNSSQKDALFNIKKDPNELEPLEFSKYSSTITKSREILSYFSNNVINTCTTDDCL